MKKYELLKNTVRRLCGRLGAAVAYSGGADSALLLKAALDALGDSRVMAFIGDSPTYPAAEMRAAKALARKMGVRFVVVRTEELRKPSFYKNPPERCYHCKDELFSKIRSIARRYGDFAVLHGATVSDDTDFRPGERAASKWRVSAPLREAGFDKSDVRRVSRSLGLPTASKPSQACLASRFPYAETITPEKLALVGKAEEFLSRAGFRDIRVRYHAAGPSSGGKVARLELGRGELSRAFRMKDVIARALKKIGFTYVALDIEGFRTGSQNLIFRRRP